MEHSRFVTDSSPDPREVESLKDRIDTFNVDATKIYDFKELAIFVRDPTGQMTAGLYAYTGGVPGYQAGMGTRGLPWERAWIEPDAGCRTGGHCQRVSHGHAGHPQLPGP